MILKSRGAEKVDSDSGGEKVFFCCIFYFLFFFLSRSDGRKLLF